MIQMFVLYSSFLDGSSNNLRSIGRIVTDMGNRYVDHLPTRFFKELFLQIVTLYYQLTTMAFVTNLYRNFIFRYRDINRIASECVPQDSLNVHIVQLFGKGSFTFRWLWSCLSSYGATNQIFLSNWFTSAGQPRRLSNSRSQFGASGPTDSTSLTSGTHRNTEVSKPFHYRFVFHYTIKTCDLLCAQTFYPIKLIEFIFGGCIQPLRALAPTSIMHFVAFCFRKNGFEHFSAAVAFRN